MMLAYPWKVHVSGRVTRMRRFSTNSYNIKWTHSKLSGIRSRGALAREIMEALCHCGVMTIVSQSQCWDCLGSCHVWPRCRGLQKRLGRPSLAILVKSDRADVWQTSQGGHQVLGKGSVRPFPAYIIWSLLGYSKSFWKMKALLFSQAAKRIELYSACSLNRPHS